MRIASYLSITRLVGILAGCLQACVLTIAAQAQYRPDDSNIYFSHINSSNTDLSYNCVNALLQDERGFIWAGTSDGLNRFDGTNFRVYGKEDLGLNSAFIVTLHEDDGGIWIGTDSGVAYYSYTTDCIEPFTTVSDRGTVITGKATVIASDRDNNIWFAVNEQGVFRYNRATKSLSNYFTSKGKRLPANVRSIYFHPDGKCWIGLYYHNLYTPDWNNETIRPVTIDGDTAAFANDNIVGMIESPHQSVFLTSVRHGLCEIDSTGHLRQLMDNGFGFEPENMTFDRNRRIWIASLSGIYRYNTVTGATDRFLSDINDPFSISDNYIHAITVARDGSVWVGTNSGGLDYSNLAGLNFRKIYIPASSGSGGAGVTGMAIDHDGNIWCSTMKSGIVRCLHGSRSGHQYPIPGLPTETFAICCIDNEIWTSTLNGIYRIDLTTGRTRLYDRLTDETELKESKRATIHPTAGGDILIGTTLGMFRYDREADTFSSFDHISKYYITDMVEDMQGNLWLTTFANGLVHYDPERQRILKEYRNSPADPGSLPSNKLMGVTRDNLGRIWTASFGGGVSMLDESSGRFTTYNRASTGIPAVSDVTYHIVEDNSGILWISTNKGLMSLNPSSGEMRIYTVANGILNNDFTHARGFKNDDGAIHFCSANGIIAFNPLMFNQSDNPGRLIVTGLTINGREIKASSSGSPLKRSIDITDHIDLSHDCNSIGFSISDLGSTTSLGETSVYYSFCGYDSTWKQLPADGRIEYPNLPPGEYSLRFKRIREDGADTTAHASITVRIAQVFYKTRIAITLYIILILALIGMAAYYYYKRQLRKERMKQEYLRREQEIDAYNEKMALFSSIANRLRSPLALIRNPLKNILHNQRNGGELIDDLMVISNGADQLSLLLQDFSDSHEEEPPAPSTDDGNDTEPVPHILIVENSDGSLTDIKDALSQQKYKITCVSSADVAIEILPRIRPDLIIAEAALKNSSGNTLCHTIHNMPDYRNIPVIIAGDFPSPVTRTEAMKAGAALTIDYPCAADYITACVTNIIERTISAGTSGGGQSSVILLTDGGDIQQITDTDAEFIRELDAIVMENIGDSDFGNEQLAAKLCMSKSTLIRRTRNVLGTTPNDYMLNKRLAIAARMLQNPNCRINEVCYSIGFNTPSYFTKCFKKVYGMLPSEYKDRNHETDNSTQ